MSVYIYKLSYFRPSRPLEIAQWIIPDVVIFLTIIIVKKILKSRKDENEHIKSATTGDSLSDKHEHHQHNEELTKKRYKLLKNIGVLSSIASLGFAGIIQPSAINGIYFISFLGFSSWLSCNRKVIQKFAILLRIISIILIMHIIGIIFYQTPLFQVWCKDSGWLFRVIFSLSKIYSSTRHSISMEFNMNLNYDVYLNPFILMIAYQTITSTSNFILVREVISITKILLTQIFEAINRNRKENTSKCQKK